MFISWSGEPSRGVASVLREYIPLFNNEVDPFLSGRDIEAGTRWEQEVAQRLERSQVGLICVTGANVRSPYLNFEAGAISKAVDDSNVIPFAIDVAPADVPPPLGIFRSGT